MSIQTLGAATDTTWTACAGCKHFLYTKRLDRNLKVCPECGHHHRLTAEERAAQLFDPRSVRVLDLKARSNDVLGFTDTKPYPARVEDARRRTGLEEGVLVVEATVEGLPVVAAIMDFRFLGGSLGAAAGELITQAGEEALLQRVPFLIVTASGGARMQEGTISLMQMAKTSQMIARLDEAGVMTVALITDPTFGGVSASFATQCDVIIAEPGARMGFAGRRVIEQTIGGPLPEGFQTAEYLFERGLVDVVRPRAQLRATLRRLFAVMSPRQAPGIDPPAYGVLADDEIELPEIDAWQAVQQARRLDRPTTLDYVERVFTDFEELHGDRMGEESPAIVGGFAALAGRPVMVIGNQRGHTVAELSRRNYGMAPPSGYRKAMRLMRLAGKLSIPVVTFVDTPGAFPGVAAEDRGQSFAIAESILLLSSLPVPVVTLIIGEGGSGGALALAVADKVYIGDGGVYSVISAEGCASILFNDAGRAPDAARALKLDARSLLETNIVDGVIREPEGGSHTDHDEAADRVAAVLHQTLSELAKSGSAELVEARRTRFRSFGSVPERELIGGR